eukprot:TRINITY_DN5581_c0_g1_i1.p1 TRINITY_DN5581_c0_g1~~TRINITY_DN5581_c0_g1_i1.p1  ORF type:complete len:110 (+),score=7.66 TRINITY_DN5581_c0_g1_i1:540-869(+)
MIEIGEEIDIMIEIEDTIVIEITEIVETIEIVIVGTENHTPAPAVQEEIVEDKEIMTTEEVGTTEILVVLLTEKDTITQIIADMIEITIQDNPIKACQLIDSEILHAYS